jgi:hypothetical protein
MYTTKKKLKGIRKKAISSKKIKNNIKYIKYILTILLNSISSASLTYLRFHHQQGLQESMLRSQFSAIFEN